MELTFVINVLGKAQSVYWGECIILPEHVNQRI